MKKTILACLLALTCVITGCKSKTVSSEAAGSENSSAVTENNESAEGNNVNEEGSSVSEGNETAGSETPENNANEETAGETDDGGVEGEVIEVPEPLEVGDSPGIEIGEDEEGSW